MESFQFNETDTNTWNSSVISSNASGTNENSDNFAIPNFEPIKNWAYLWVPLVNFVNRCVTMPFVVITILLQVQHNSTDKMGNYRPSLEQGEKLKEHEEEEKDHVINSVCQDNEINSKTELKSRKQRPKHKDEDLIRRSSYLVRLQIDGGLFQMFRNVRRSPEGLSGLWKGTFTSWLLRELGEYVQPLFSSGLSSIFFKSFPVESISNLITDVAVSPLSLVLTRMIVQSTSVTSAGVSRRAYSGPVDALCKISHDEGGWLAMWTHPNLLFPAVLESALQNLLTICGSLLVDRLLSINIESNPITYMSCVTLWNILSSALIFPITTVRRRLQVQDRSLDKGHNAKRFVTCVETPLPSAGIVECINQMVTEDCSSESRWYHIKTLLRGLSIQFYAILPLLFFNCIAGAFIGLFAFFAKIFNYI
ncbi:hypothetical protein E3P86_02691 [Wallemia ichthyophaga]|uniref:Uncharacterized protein n=1 Tax=Wallemia ichthyophaga TaxID=245174 RepID=A0A4T0J2C4_WALIC|nr:hypothetical protein E3P86_02691 [Wallemia ichthyophaga]